jgi:hypothetical protein
LNVVDGLPVPFGEPVTVIGYVPEIVAAVVDIVSVELHVAVHGFVVYVGVAPIGRPEALIVIEAEPETAVRVIVEAPEAPGSTVTFPLFVSV